jgi:hypothetical protein
MAEQEIMKTKIILNDLSKLASDYLQKYYLADKKIFPFTTKLVDGELKPLGISVRYTLISLIGLFGYRKRGNEIKIPLEKIILTFMSNMQDINNLGDLGLLLWAASLISNGHDLEELLRTVLEKEKRNLLDTKKPSTLELEFYLIGLCHILKRIEHADEVRQRVDVIHDLLMKKFNQRTGLFSFGSYIKNAPMKNLYNSRTGFFAEQIYGVYALINHFEVMKKDDALKNAVLCADTICKFQTKFGEWQWVYNVPSGFIVEKYPIYSVHQDGMAPMVLLKLARFTDKKYIANVLRGLEWLVSYKMSSEPLLDDPRQVIWRSVRRKQHWHQKAPLKKAAGLLNIDMNAVGGHASSSLEVDYETRPYCYGWVLQAQNELYSYLLETSKDNM